jgi:ABC-type nitrate/sulfonate/bicarbonate transport system permease component
MSRDAGVSTRSDAEPMSPPVQRLRKAGPRQRIGGFVRTAPGVVLLVVSLVCLIAVWQYAQTKVRSIPTLYLPPPSAIWDALVQNFDNGEFQKNIAYSLKNYGVGLVIGASAGVAIGLVAGGIRKVNIILTPYIWALYSTPNIAFQPILIVALGFTPLPKIIMIIMGVVFPIIVNTIAGVEKVDGSLIRAARVFGANRLQLYLKVAVPYTIPFIMTGLRLGATRGLLYMYISEIYGSTSGLGYMVLQATHRFQTPVAFAGVILLVVLSILIVQALQVIPRFLPYTREARI